MDVGWHLTRWWRWLGLAAVMLPCTSLQARQVLYAAMDDWPPFIIAKRSLASDSGFDGIDWELLQELSARTGIEIYPIPYPIPYPFARGLKELQVGRVDLITSVIKTEERSKYLGYFQTPYYECHAAFYAQPEMAVKIRRYDDLYGKRIGYTLGSAYFEPFDSDKKLRKSPSLNENKLPFKLLKRNDQVFVGTDCQVDYALSEQGLRGQIVPTIYKPEQRIELYIAYSKAAGIEKEAALLDKALSQLVAEGWVNKLANGYFNPVN